jgi:non-canonical (house-cleaning) NTP pyrophosphatase
MHFVIGTLNTPKSEAIASVLQTSPYTQGATFSNYKVASGVPDMPLSLTDIRAGARNRARNCRRECSEGDYYIGME